MTVSDVLPFGCFVALIVGIGGSQFVFWRRRNAAFHALAEKYRLREFDGWGSAPDPEIRGVVFPAFYPRYVEGSVEGASVVVFDFAIGIGRGKRLGSGVGVQRAILQPDKLSRRMLVRHKDGWTFVFTNPYRFSIRRLPVAELERMLHLMLIAPARESAGPQRVLNPGEIHIRPRRRLAKKF